MTPRDSDELHVVIGVKVEAATEELGEMRIHGARVKIMCEGIEEFFVPGEIEYGDIRS